MTKPIWELEPNEIDEELARPKGRVPRQTELGRIEQRLTDLSTAVSSQVGVDDAAAEFENAGDTMFAPNAWQDHVAQDEAVDQVDKTEIVAPSAEPIAPFSPPTAKISRDQLETLRAQLKTAAKK